MNYLPSCQIVTTCIFQMEMSQKKLSERWQKQRATRVSSGTNALRGTAYVCEDCIDDEKDDEGL